MDYQKKAEMLREHGVVVIATDINVKTFREKIDQDIEAFPEYNGKQEKYVLGGFSAFGNPASFHCPSVRELRELVHPYGMKLAEAYGSHKRCEQLIDRLMVRPPKVSATKESWHRDESPAAGEDDIVLGGWINLDDKDQFFSCVPGTHTEVRGFGGFSIVPKDEHAELNDAAIKVQIPPGAIIFFHEHIIHEVIANKLNYASYRLFVGWRFTNSKKPLFEETKSALKNQAVVKIKSGQVPPMWAKLHWTNFAESHLVPFAKAFKKQVLVERTMKSGLMKGRVFTIPPREMGSLKSLKLPLYKAYSKTEKKMHKPRRITKFFKVKVKKSTN